MSDGLFVSLIKKDVACGPLLREQNRPPPPDSRKNASVHLIRADAARGLHLPFVFFFLPSARTESRHAMRLRTVSSAGRVRSPG